MKKSEYFIGRYKKSHLSVLIRNQSRFLDELMQKYLRAICRQFPVDDRCIDNLLKIEDFEIKPIDIGTTGRAGNLIADYDKATMTFRYKMEMYPNIDTAFLKNEFPEGLTGEDLNKYKREVLRHIVIFLHELTHAMNFVEFFRLDEERDDLVRSNAEEAYKIDGTYYIAHGGLITDRQIVRANKVEQGTNLNKNYIYEAMTEFIAHNALLDREFSDIQYFYMDDGITNPFKIDWSYAPFVDIAFALNYLFNNAFSIAYFTGDTKISGFDKSCLEVDITNISVPIRMIVKNIKSEDFDPAPYIKTLVVGIKEFLSYIQETIKREDVKSHLNEERIENLNQEIKNIYNHNDYLKFIVEDLTFQMDKENIEKLRGIFESEFKNIKPIVISSEDVLNLNKID